MWCSELQQEVLRRKASFIDVAALTTDPGFVSGMGG
jgi:hypothetical protein